MGNRAVITTNENRPNNEKLGVYVHWNGGRDSVQGFLTYCKIAGFRNPIHDEYGWARLTQVIANMFGGGLSVGVDTLNRLDCNNGDNGMYIFNEDWEIVDRMYFDGAEQNEYDLKEFVLYLDSNMPKKQQIGTEKIEEYFNKKD
jgi:hypothetical protein